MTDEGIDTRIHGIKLTSESEKEPGLNQDLFSSKELIRYDMLVLTNLNSYEQYGQILITEIEKYYRACRFWPLL